MSIEEIAAWRDAIYPLIKTGKKRKGMIGKPILASSHGPLLWWDMMQQAWCDKFFGKTMHSYTGEPL